MQNIKTHFLNCSKAGENALCPGPAAEAGEEADHGEKSSPFAHAPSKKIRFNSTSGQDVPRRGVPLRRDLGEVHQEALRVGGEEGNQVSEGASLESIAKPFAKKITYT